jgi:hypothetical protein
MVADEPFDRVDGMPASHKPRICVWMIAMQLPKDDSPARHVDVASSALRVLHPCNMRFLVGLWITRKSKVRAARAAGISMQCLC